MNPRSSWSVLFTICRRAASSLRERSGSTLYRRSLISDCRTTFAIAWAGPSWTWRATRRSSSRISAVIFACSVVKLATMLLGACWATLVGHLRPLDPPLAHRVHDGLGAVVHRELAQDARHVVLHRLLGDREGVGDLLVRHPLGDVVEDLDLSRRQRSEDVRAAGPVHRELAEFGEHLRRDRGLREDLLVDDELAVPHL